MKKVGVIMGSDSDLPVVEKAIDKLKEYGVPYEVHVYSAHRTPVQAGEFAGQPRRTDLGRSSRPREGGASGRGAGGQHHAAGDWDSRQILHLGRAGRAAVHGADAHRNPCGHRGIDGAANAALLAIQILAVSDMALAEKIRQARAAESQKVFGEKRRS